MDTMMMQHTSGVTQQHHRTHKSGYILKSGDIARLTPTEVAIFNDGTRVERRTEAVDWDAEAAGKSGYDHHMLKEIHEQPRALRQTISGRINGLETMVSLDVDLPTEYLLNR
jgi:glutamine--fructose-6-phosphate transaminase (EC 2.6.1.16)